MLFQLFLEKSHFQRLFIQRLFCCCGNSFSCYTNHLFSHTSPCLPCNSPPGHPHLGEGTGEPPEAPESDALQIMDTLKRRVLRRDHVLYDRLYRAEDHRVVAQRQHWRDLRVEKRIAATKKRKTSHYKIPQRKIQERRKSAINRRTTMTCCPIPKEQKFPAQNFYQN